MRYIWKVEYNGTKFFGWQSQPNLRCIQSDFEIALMRVIPEKVKICGASRTDVGVSARGQIIHADLVNVYCKNRLFYGVQNFLKDISIVSSCFAPPNFHARYSAIGKYYRYQIINRIAKPLLSNAWWVKSPLNIDQMQTYANLNFLGTHDFNQYCSIDDTRKNTIKTISKFDVTKIGDIIKFKIVGNSFLMHQIRLMISKLVLIGMDKEGNPHNYKAPGYGLCLKQIYYNQLLDLN